MEAFLLCCESIQFSYHNFFLILCRSNDVTSTGDVSENDLCECLELLHLLCLSYGIPSKSLLDLLVLQYSVVLFLLICDTRWCNLIQYPKNHKPCHRQRYTSNHFITHK